MSSLKDLDDKYDKVKQHLRDSLNMHKTGKVYNTYEERINDLEEWMVDRLTLLLCLSVTREELDKKVDRPFRIFPG